MITKNNCTGKNHLFKYVPNRNNFEYFCIEYKNGYFEVNNYPYSENMYITIKKYKYLGNAKRKLYDIMRYSSTIYNDCYYAEKQDLIK